MTAPTARLLLLACLAIGVVAEILFIQGALGINVPIATAVLLAVLTVVGRRHGRPDRADLWLPLVAIAASALVAVRSDGPIITLDIGLTLAACAAWSIATAGVSVTREAATRIGLLGLWAGMSLASGASVIAARALSDDPLVQARATIGRGVPIIRGVLIAVPVMVVFAGLLASADAVFAHLVDGLLSLPVDPLEPVRRVALALAFGFLAGGPVALAAGLLPLGFGAVADTGGAISGQAAHRASSRPGGTTEAVVVLGSVAAVFAIFVVVQFQYLFGGGNGLSVTGLPYSTYAREGYFQLVAVVGLSGLLVLTGNTVAGRSAAFRATALLLLGLTAAILVSAAVRLSLYLQAYGWTELRFYVLASIAWLAVGGGATIVLLARDGMRWVAHGLAITAIAVTLGVSAIGPQAFVTGQNVARALDPGLVPPDGQSGLDLAYLLTLDDDAVPALVRSLEGLSAADRSTVLVALAGRRLELDQRASAAGWAGWNLSREQARAALSTLPPR